MEKIASFVLLKHFNATAIFLLKTLITRGNFCHLNLSGKSVSCLNFIMCIAETKKYSYKFVRSANFADISLDYSGSCNFRVYVCLLSCCFVCIYTNFLGHKGKIVPKINVLSWLTIKKFSNCPIFLYI